MQLPAKTFKHHLRKISMSQASCFTIVFCQHTTALVSKTLVLDSDITTMAYEILNMSALDIGTAILYNRMSQFCPVTYMESWNHVKFKAP